MFIVDEWMSSFYGKKWVLINSPDFILDNSKNIFYEWRIEATEQEVLQKAFEMGFELVETDVEFETEIFSDTSNLPSFIRPGKEEDLEEILELIKICFTENINFYNRLKNQRYFTPQQCEDYFKQSIINNFKKEGSISTVAVKKEKLVGFYIIKEIQQGKYKVISTGVHPSSRGENIHIDLQRKLTDIIKKPYVLINRTQLGNYPVIKNHIREKRNLSKIEHIMYLSL